MKKNEPCLNPMVVALWPICSLMIFVSRHTEILSFLSVLVNLDLFLATVAPSECVTFTALPYRLGRKHAA